MGATPEAEKRPKDIWDKWAAITPLVLGLLVSGGAAIFGAIHNSKQDKLAEISALDKFQPRLNSPDPLEREFAYSAFVALGYDEIALRLIRLRKDLDAEGIVQSIKQSNRSLAAEANATLKTLHEAQGPDGRTVKFQTTSDGTVSFEDGWNEKNIVPVEIPQLRGIAGAPASGMVLIYKDAAADLKAAFAELEEKQLISRIKSWDGSYAPRTTFGTSRMSSHAWGTAFDINAAFNPMFEKPLEAGTDGSVVELVPIFKKHHFEWGGTFSMPDGTHFQWVPLQRRK